MNAAPMGGRRSGAGSPPADPGPPETQLPSVLVLTREASTLPAWLHRGANITTTIAGTAAEARDYLRGHEVDAVVVDRSFAVDDRAGLLRWLRGAGPHVLLLGAARGRRGEGATVRLSLEAPGRRRLARMPVRRGDEIVLLPVREIASLEADGELVHVTTVRGERHTISRPLKTLEARLEDAFLRLSRGVLVNVAAVVRLRVLPRGGLSAVLVNGAEHTVSRSQLPHVRRRLMDL